MRIETFTHSPRRDQNRRLFGLIGEFCANDAIRKILGAAITSRPGQVWFVALEGRAVLAFASLRLDGTDCQLRHLCSPADDGAAWEAVLRRCIGHARHNHARLLRLTDFLAAEGRYAPFGFVPHGPQRGRFTQYILSLESLYGAAQAMD